jgi:hypothetical protein
MLIFYYRVSACSGENVCAGLVQQVFSLVC